MNAPCPCRNCPALKPPADFAVAYRQHVAPKLRQVIALHSLLVALNHETFSEAFNTVMHEAVRLGAGFLAEPHFVELSDWLGANMVSQIASNERAVDAAAALADDVAADLAGWERSLMESRVDA